MSDYDFPTTGSVCRQRPCGCSVGLLSDVQEVAENVRMHAGSLPNPWIVIPCKRHASLESASEVVARQTGGAEWIPLGSWCPLCGPEVAVDEDGCCAMCGATAMGLGADAALALYRAAKGLIDDVRKARSGHEDPPEDA